MAPRPSFATAFRRLPWVLALALASLGAGVARAQGGDSGAALEGAGPKGAQIYCFMRNSGNNHQVSWDASYAVIKRQSDQLFKTSPEHAAVMITEAVVQNPGTYSDCGRYLGDLFSKPDPVEEAPATSRGATRNERFGTY
ncbi:MULTISPECIES: DUF6554 family protein [Aphanothece]|uniref:DUF6554 family protein n=1 Tax=Aphanothece TaxID=1121 RepID=UPI0039848947